MPDLILTLRDGRTLEVRLDYTSGDVTDVTIDGVLAQSLPSREEAITYLWDGCPAWDDARRGWGVPTYDVVSMARVRHEPTDPVVF